MRLEKRDITLNEIDSVKDVLTIEKILLREYASALENARRKELVTYLTQALQNVAQEIFLLNDVLQTLQETAI